MKKMACIGSFLILCCGAFAATEIHKTTVHFPSDVHLLDDDAKNTLLRFLNTLEIHGDYEFQIHGHTDHEGDHAYNNALSQRRAAEVQAWFKSKDVEANVIFVEAFGKQQLLIKGYDPGAMKKNRRVDVVFKRFKFEHTDELLAELARSAENRFLIDPNTNQTITCNRGSMIYIPENAFMDADCNPVTEPVHIEIIEALDFHDFLAHNLSTVSDGQILQTGGMLNISAFTESGDPVYLKDSAGLDIAIPSLRESPLDDMELFVSDSGQNWTPTSQPNLSTELNLPDRPIFEYPRMHIPKYTDDLGAPRYPGMPSYPLAPTVPRWESYHREVKWYQFFWKARIMADNQKRYNRAMDAYAVKDQQFQAAVEKYHDDCAKHPLWVAEYEMKLADYKAERAARYSNYENTELKEAQTRHRALYAKAQEKYRTQKAVYDSLETIRLDGYYNTLSKMGFPPNTNLNYYLFRSSGLGWINCDRFWASEPNDLITMNAQLPDTDEAQVMLIFPKGKMAISMYSATPGSFTSSGIPKNEEVLVLAYKVNGDGIFYARRLMRGKQNVKLEYQPVKLNEFREFMKELQV